MRAPFLENEILLAALEVFTGERTDLRAAERSFSETRGDFREKLTAALRAVTAAQLKPERFIEIPASPESLSRAELKALVEPNVVFISSGASKAELVSALRDIRYRQESRPAWMPRTPDSVPRSAEGGNVANEDSNSAFTRVPLALTGLHELGPIAAEVPSWYEDPVQAPDDLTATAVQLALLVALGIGPDPRTDQAVNAEDPIPSPFSFVMDDNVEAGPVAALSAEGGPVAVIELLATTATLGSLSVQDDESEDAALSVLASAGDWWHSPAIMLDCVSPFCDGAWRTVARCSAAGWADVDSRSTGFVILADAVAADSEGTIGMGGSALHRFMLWWESSESDEPKGDSEADTQLDLSAGSLHRLILHCPGEDRCLRDECSTVDTLDTNLTTALIAVRATAVSSMLAGGDWATSAYLRTLADGDDPGVYEEPGAIMWIVEQALADCGWRVASHGFWDTGDVGCLLTRDEHVILVQHHLAERALSVLDGMEELALLGDMHEESEAHATSGNAKDDPSGDRDHGPVGDASQHAGDNDHEEGEDTEEAVFRECLQRLASGTLLPIAGLGVYRTPLFTIWPWGDGQPHGDEANERIAAWIKGWLRGLPLIA